MAVCPVACRRIVPDEGNKPALGDRDLSAAGEAIGMKALVVQTLSEDLSGVMLADIPTPEPGPNEARVAIEAASLNYPDLLMTRGAYQFKPDPPFVSGMDFSGRVDAVGPGVDPSLIGRRVSGGGKTGAFAEAVCVPANALTETPPMMDACAAAAFPAAYSTAHVCLLARGRLQAGETAVILGASGGVGAAACDVARMLGARVIAVTSSPDKAAALREYGVSDVIVGASFAAAVKEMTDGRGADLVLDPIGGDATEEGMHALAWGGRLLIVGFAGGPPARLRANHALIKGLSILGVRAGEFGRRFPEEGQRTRDDIWRWAAEGRVHPLIGGVYSLADWRQAFIRMQDRRLVGKLILRP
jgi:NADPH2:quinone reductase